VSENHGSDVSSTSNSITCSCFKCISWRLFQRNA